MESSSAEDWDSVAHVNLLSLSYLLFYSILQRQLRANSKVMESVRKYYQMFKRKGNRKGEFILSGSVAEGLAIMPGLCSDDNLRSDLDIMYCFKRIFTVHDSDSDLHAGYARLKIFDKMGSVNME